MGTDLWGVETSCPSEVLPLWDSVLARTMRLDEGGVPDDLDRLCAEAPAFGGGWAFAALWADDMGDTVEAADRAARATEHAGGGTERERSFVACTQKHVEAGLWATASTWQEHCDRFPEDLVALMQVLTLSMFGARADGTEAFARAADRAGGVLGEVAPVRDLRAWVAQERGRIDEAHALCDSLVQEDPRHVSAAHAKAHTFYESADHEAGVRWLDDWVDGLAGDEPPYNRHLSWHAGLHEVALGHEDRALRRLCADTADEATRRPSDAALMITALQSLGHLPWGQDPTGVLSAMIEVADEPPPLLFNGYTRSLGLAAIGDADALRRFSAASAACDVPGVAELVPPFALGLAHWVEGDPVSAARYLDEVASRFALFGGSLAQRDVLHDVYVAVLVDAGRGDDAVAWVASRDQSRGIGVERRLLRSSRRRAAPSR